MQDVDSAGRGGEYTVQAGFGWTNGVLLWVASTYGDVLVAPECPDIAVSAGVGSPEGGSSGDGGEGGGDSGSSDGGEGENDGDSALALARSFVPLTLIVAISSTLLL